MSESNWPAPAENPSRSDSASKHHQALVHEQRPGLEQIPRRGRGRGRALARTRPSAPLAAGRHDAARLGPYDPAIGSCGAGAPVEPDLAERPVRVTQEEAADDCLVDAARDAPDVQMLRLREMDARTRVERRGCRTA